MNPGTKVARWHWRAEVAARWFELRLIHRHVPADPDTFPYVEGHRFMLEWHDMFYPEVLGNGSAEMFITEVFRLDTAVVRAQGVGGVPFWDQLVTDGLSVRVALAAPERRFGDDVDADRAFRVSYRDSDQRRYVARLDAAKASLSAVAATDLC